MIEGSSDREHQRDDDEEAVQRYRQMVERHGSVSVEAGELVSDFGQPDMTFEAREAVADELWEAGLSTQPSLVGRDVRVASIINVTVVDEQRLQDAVVAESKRKTRYKISPLSVGIAVLGGALLAVAAFLPLDEAVVRDNTLAQQGDWWVALVGAVAAVIALRSLTTGKRSEADGVILMGALAMVGIVVLSQEQGLRTVAVYGEEVGTVSFGIAIYLAGAGALSALIGGVLMRQTAEPINTPSEEMTQRCPDCAEVILAAARICKHCGAELDTDEARPRYPPAPSRSELE